MDLLIRIKDKKDYKFLRELTKLMGLATKEISSAKIYDEELSKGEIQLLEERWTDYVKNPKAVEKWSDVKKELKKKHAR